MPSPRLSVLKSQYTVGDAARDYLQDFIRKGFHSVKATRNIAEFHIVPMLGHIRVQSLTRDDVKAWVESIIIFHGRTPHYRGGPRNFKLTAPSKEDTRRRRQTANRTLQTLKAILNFALKEGHVSCDGSAWREFPYFVAARNTIIKFLSLEEQRMLVAACEGDFRRLVMGALYSGARFGELCQLRVSNLSENSIYVPEAVAKTRRDRIINLDPSASSFFRSLSRGRHPDDFLFTLHGDPWNNDYQWKQMRAATFKAELLEFRFRDLRNTAASNWVRAGIPLKYIAEQLGNTVAICEKHYARVSADDRSMMFSRLPAHCISGMENFSQF